MKKDQRIIIPGAPTGVDPWNDPEPIYSSSGYLVQDISYARVGTVLY